MIEDWYFSTCVGLPPARTQAFLDIMDGLGAPLTDPALVLASFDELARMEWMVRRFAFGQVLGAAVGTANNSGHPKIVAVAKAEMSHVLEVLDTAIRGPAKQAIDALVGEVDDDVVGHLGTAAHYARHRSLPAPSSRPYLDTEDFTTETVLLSVALQAMRLTPTSAEAVIEHEDLAALVHRALRYRFGRRPFLLAIEIAAFAGDRLIDRDSLVVRLCAKATGSAAYEPDLLAAYARLCFGSPGSAGHDAPAGEVVDAISAEVVGLECLRRLIDRARPGDQDETAVTRLGLDGMPAPVISAVVWQSVLWALAAETKPRETTEVVSGCWIPPHKPIVKPVAVSAPVNSPRRWRQDLESLARLRGTQAGRSASFSVNKGDLRVSTRLSILVLTPWLDRVDDRWVARGDRAKFPRGRDGLVLLRLFFAVLTAAELLRAVNLSQSEADVARRKTLVGLIMHGADVISDGPHRSFVQSLGFEASGAVPSMSTPLAALALHMKRVTDRMGVGRIPQVEPRWFAELAVDAPDRDSTPLQEARLRGRPAQNLLGFWILDALSAASPEDANNPVARWRQPVIADDPASVTVAEWVLEASVARQHVGLVARPAAMLAVYFRNVTAGQSRLTSWHLTDDGLAGVTNDWTALGGGWLSATDWLNQPPLSSLRDRNGTREKTHVRRALATERLLAAFRADGEIDQDTLEAWADEWRTLHAKVRSRKELARPVRMRLLDLLSSAQAGTDLERQVLEDVIDIEIEFGLGTPVDRWLLLHHLGADTALPHFAQTLRVRLLRGLYHRDSTPAPHLPARSPWAALDDIRLTELLDRLLQRFVVAVGHLPFVDAGHQHLRELIPELWREAHRVPLLVEHPVLRTGRAAVRDLDRRLLAGVTADRVRDTMTLHLLRPPVAPPGVDTLLDPHRLPPNGLLDALTGGRAHVTGVVCATAEGVVWVNCGLAEPVEAAPPRKYQPGVGDLVAVPLERAVEPPYRVTGPVVPLDGAAQPADIRQATVTSFDHDGGKWLRIRLAATGLTPVEFTTVDLLRDRPEACRLWDVDVLRTHREQDLAPVQTVARYDGAVWLPVDRGMVEFLAEEATTGVPIRLVVIDDLADRDALRCSSAPGRNVVIPYVTWRPEDAATLRAWVGGENDPSGLVVTATVVTDGGQPRLALMEGDGESEDRRVDLSNLRWRRLFQDVHELVATRKTGGVWTCAVADSPVPEIRVSGLQVAESTTNFVPGTWDDQAQRRAVVHGEKVATYELKLERTPQDFRRVADLGRRDVLTLDFVPFVQSTGVLRAYTTERLPVDVDAESLTFAPLDPTRHLHTQLVRDRPAEVVFVQVLDPKGPPAHPTPMSKDELIQAMSPEDGEIADDLLVRTASLRGIVVQVPRKRRGGSDHERYTVWLESGSEILSASLPHSAFDHPPTRVGAVVNARRTPSGWVFTARARLVRVRAWWQVDERDAPQRGDLFLGLVQWKGWTKALVQARGGPTLRICPAEPGPVPDHLTHLPARPNEFTLGGASVEPSRIVQDRLQRVVLTAGDLSCSGVTGQLNPTPRARATGVIMSVTRAHSAYVTAQRLFTVDDARGVYTVLDRATDPLARYNAYLASERAPLEAELLAGGVGVELRTGWPVPVAGAPSTTVPLLPGERPWVDTRYDATASVVLCGSDQDQLVSYRNTPPVGLGAFFSVFQRQGLVANLRTRLRTPLHYVERRSTPRGVVHRFEWGYGKVLEVGDTELTIDGAPSTRRPAVLFHSDIIREIKLLSTKDGQYRLDIAQRHIDGGWYSWLYEEAKAGAVHLAEIETDADGTRPRIVRVTTRGRLRSGSQEGQGTTRVALSRAKLSPTAATLINETLRAEPSASRSEDGYTIALVKLDLTTTDRFLRSGGSDVTFDYLPPDKLPPDSRVFMTATGITPLNNDVRLELTLGAVLGTGNGRTLTAGVLKRDFSRRTQLLSQIFESDKESGDERTRHLRGTVYFVRLSARGARNRGHRASIRDALARPVRTLKSLLRNTSSPLFAVATPIGSGRVELELEPNIVFRLGANEVTGASDVFRGSVVRLGLVSGDRVSLETALVGDMAYLPSSGRPAVLLPLESLLSSRKTLTQALRDGAYAVAGLPSITVAATSGKEPTEFERTMATTPHPRVAWVRRDGQALAPLPERYLAAHVQFDDRGAARLVPVGTGAASDVQLAHLSFMDGGANAVRRRCASTGWTYHDQTTTHRDPANSDKVPPTRLPSPARVTGEPVFFSPGWTLRHRTDDLFRLGFPATGLVDSLAGGNRPRPGTAQAFPVAGVARMGRRVTGIWVEQAPGRLVHLTGSMIHIAVEDDVVSLDRFGWDHVAPGDMVQLSAVATTETEIPTIELDRWLPGPRGAFGERALLPVDQADPAAGLVRLGAGIWRLDRPLDPDTAVPSRPVWLDSRNDITEIGADPGLRRDDVVLLSERDGALALLGLPGARVTLAERGWSGWLRAALDDPEECVLELCGGALPVTVDSVNGHTVTVSRRLQPDTAVPSGQLISTQPLGVLTTGRILLRRGPKLSICRSADLFPGLPKSLVPAAVAALRDIEDVWLHVEHGTATLQIGLPGTGAGPKWRDEARLRPLAVLSEGDSHGVLCWETRLRRPRWLPGRAVGWTTLTAAHLVEHIVRGDQELTARIMKDGTASLVHRAVNEQRLQHLRAGDSIRLEVLSADDAEVSTGRARFVARTYLTDVLMAFEQDSADPPPVVGALRTCEIDSVRRSGGHVVVTAVDPERRMIPMDLPAWVTDPDTRGRPASVMPYHGWDRGEIEPALPSDVLVHARMVAAAGAVRRGAAVDARPAGGLRPELAETAVAWLRRYGRQALHLTSRTTLDIVPWLAAVLVLDALSATHAACGELAVRLCKHLGLSAARARHVEPLVTHWLTNENAALFDGDLWQRLDWIPVAPLLTTEQRADIRTVDSGVRARTAVRNATDLKVMTGALCNSVGLPADYDEIDVHSPDLGLLVGLARALAPHPDGGPAQRRLLKAQRALLQDVHVRLTALPPLSVEDDLSRLIDGENDGEELNMVVLALGDAASADAPVSGIVDSQ
jgi:hypothetical protein